MLLKFKDTENDIHLIDTDKIVNYCQVNEVATIINFVDGYEVKINKSIDEVETRLFQLGIKVTEL